MEKRITRAKKELQQQGLDFDVPPADELLERSMQVLRVLYLLFSEGYATHGAQVPIKADLCSEAIRLTLVLAGIETAPKAESFALLALMHFQISRFAARVDQNENLLTLEEQDRSKWDTDAIRVGFFYLEKASGGEFGNIWHVEAMIAACPRPGRVV